MGVGNQEAGSAAEFFESLGTKAKSYNTKISVIGIAGADCKLDEVIHPFEARVFPFVSQILHLCFFLDC